MRKISIIITDNYRLSGYSDPAFIPITIGLLCINMLKYAKYM